MVRGVISRVQQWGPLVLRSQTYRLLLNGRRRRVLPPRDAMEHSIDWLLTAHQVVAQKGFSSHFSVAKGWGPGYPETSGYLLPTLRAVRAISYRTTEVDQAIEQTGKWLLEIQYPEGGFDAPATAQPMVFDTGQVVFGLMALAAGKDGEAYLKAARRAGDWILTQQDGQGFWVRSAYKGIPHTYYSRVAWALVLLSTLTGDERYREAARKQLFWVSSQQSDDGWFASCSFYSDEKPVLHVIAYTIEGLWESALLLADKALEKKAVAAADALFQLEGGRGRLASHYRRGWSPAGDSACVTGLAQMALVWLRMARRYERPELAGAAERCLDFVLRHQVGGRAQGQVAGALPGSVPLWGDYFPWAFPNWGAKFLIDALMEKEGLAKSTPG